MAMLYFSFARTRVPAEEGMPPMPLRGKPDS